MSASARHDATRYPPSLVHPPLHAEHADAPATAAKEPGPHVAQVEADAEGENEPGEQGVQGMAKVAKEPGGHAEQLAAREGQGTQAEAPTEDVVPLGHAKHVASSLCVRVRARLRM